GHRRLRGRRQERDLLAPRQRAGLSLGDERPERQREGAVAHDAVPNIWQVQGIGDFDGDGKSDILWRNDSGQVYIWEMNGLNVKGRARSRMLRSPAIGTSIASARNTAGATGTFSGGTTTARSMSGR